MESKDISQVYALYKKQMEKYGVYNKFTQEQLAHHLLPKEGLVYTLVVENTETKTLTDFISFYNLPSQILKQEGHNYTEMKIAYLYYYANSKENPIIELVKQLMHYARD